MSDLALEVTLDAPFDQAIEQVQAALQEEGFGVLTRIEERVFPDTAGKAPSSWLNSLWFWRSFSA